MEGCKAPMLVLLNPSTCLLDPILNYFFQNFTPDLAKAGDIHTREGRKPPEK